MRRLVLTIAYDGSRYGGYQVQKNAITIAEVVQDAIEIVFGERLGIIGCSRTDAGVHAEGFCLSFDTDNPIPKERLPIALNSKLPDDVVVIDCRETDDNFHPRYSAIGKRYCYKVYTSALPSPFLRNYAHHYPFNLDIELMRNAASSIVGTHDFKGFSNTGGKVESTIRTVTKCDINTHDDYVIFTVEGDGFLYNMVRIIVGTLIDIGSGMISIDVIDELLTNLDRKLAGRTAPAHGLYLNEVFYEQDNGKLLPGKYNQNPKEGG